MKKRNIYERQSKTILPCKCGAMPVLCYHDYLSCYNGSYGASVYEHIRFYAYICPNCKEWSYKSEFPFVAARFWNQQIKGKWKNLYNKADNYTGVLWKSVNTNEIITGKPITNYNGF